MSIICTTSEEGRGATTKPVPLVVDSDEKLRRAKHLRRVLKLAGGKLTDDALRAIEQSLKLHMHSLMKCAGT